MALPKIPRLEKFCFCMDVHTGVLAFSIGLIVLWILYALGALFGANSTTGNGVWAVIWCAINVVVYGFVIVGMKQAKRIFLIPALIVSVFDFFVGLIQTIIAFISLWILSAIIILIIAGVTAYYALGLKTVYDDFLEPGSTASGNDTVSKPSIVNPV